MPLTCVACKEDSFPSLNRRPGARSGAQKPSPSSPAASVPSQPRREGAEVQKVARLHADPGAAGEFVAFSPLVGKGMVDEISEGRRDGGTQEKAWVRKGGLGSSCGSPAGVRGYWPLVGLYLVPVG